MRLGFCLQQLRKAEVVVLELRIFHLAVAAEVDPIKAAAESLDITIRERRGEIGKHWTLELESLAGEVAAVMGVVNHHQRPRAGGEVAPRQRRQAPPLYRLARPRRGV